MATRKSQCGDCFQNHGGDICDYEDDEKEIDHATCPFTPTDAFEHQEYPASQLIHALNRQ
jgi:hypothetical protein